MLENSKRFFMSGGFETLEKDLIQLSSYLGGVTKNDAQKKIKNFSSRLNGFSNTSEMDGYIISTFGPLVQKHYDDLGIENPNITVDEK